MEPSKIVAVATTGYTRRFFTLDLEALPLAVQPHLRLSGYSPAMLALQAGDDGLRSLGVSPGDFLLFATSLPLRAAGQLSLVRQEDEYIVRETYWDGDMTWLRVPADAYPAMRLPTENIRVAAVLADVVKNDEWADIVRF